MSQIEPYLVELILKLSDMRTPFTISQGFQIANSLINGTSIEKCLSFRNMQNKHCKASKGAMGSQVPPRIKQCSAVDGVPRIST
jgi:hypothetical protein